MEAKATPLAHTQAATDPRERGGGRGARGAGGRQRLGEAGGALAEGKGHSNGVVDMAAAGGTLVTVRARAANARKGRLWRAGTIITMIAIIT